MPRTSALDDVDRLRKPAGDQEQPGPEREARGDLRQRLAVIVAQAKYRTAKRFCGRCRDRIAHQTRRPGNSSLVVLAALAGAALDRRPRRHGRRREGSGGRAAVDPGAAGPARRPDLQRHRRPPARPQQAHGCPVPGQRAGAAEGAGLPRRVPQDLQPQPGPGPAERARLPARAASATRRSSRRTSRRRARTSSIRAGPSPPAGSFRSRARRRPAGRSRAGSCSTSSAAR